MITEVKTGDLVGKWSAADFSEVARRLNKARGANGCRVSTDSDGGLRVELGDDQFQFRTLTMAEPVRLEDGSYAIAFRKVRALCDLPSDSAEIVTLDSASGWQAVPVLDEDGLLTAIEFRETSDSDPISIAVEPCSSF